eukprot:scaffold6331_cov403-Prasinococcus_capsulatus_cf.AAC.2
MRWLPYLFVAILVQLVPGPPLQGADALLWGHSHHHGKMFDPFEEERHLPHKQHYILVTDAFTNPIEVLSPPPPVPSADDSLAQVVGVEPSSDVTDEQAPSEPAPHVEEAPSSRPDGQLLYMEDADVEMLVEKLAALPAATPAEDVDDPESSPGEASASSQSGQPHMSVRDEHVGRFRSPADAAGTEVTDTQAPLGDSPRLGMYGQSLQEGAKARSSPGATSLGTYGHRATSRSTSP